MDDPSTTLTHGSAGPLTITERITSPDTTHTDFAYDLAGRGTSVTDHLGRTTYYTYDPYGRLSTLSDSTAAAAPRAGTRSVATVDLVSSLVPPDTSR